MVWYLLPSCGRVCTILILYFLVLSLFPSDCFRSQMTCLMFAAKRGFSKVINLLMSYGAEINAQDTYGYTVSHCIPFACCVWFKLHFCLQALSMAVQHGKQEAVLMLLQLGADKTLKTKTGKCPADLAAIFKNTQVQFFYHSFKNVRVYSVNRTLFLGHYYDEFFFLHKC